MCPFVKGIIEWNFVDNIMLLTQSSVKYIEKIQDMPLLKTKIQNAKYFSNLNISKCKMHVFLTYVFEVLYLLCFNLHNVRAIYFENLNCGGNIW